MVLSCALLSHTVMRSIAPVCPLRCFALCLYAPCSLFRATLLYAHTCALSCAKLRCSALPSLTDSCASPDVHCVCLSVHLQSRYGIQTSVIFQMSSVKPPVLLLDDILSDDIEINYICVQGLQEFRKVDHLVTLSQRAVMFLLNH